MIALGLLGLLAAEAALHHRRTAAAIAAGREQFELLAELRSLSSGRAEAAGAVGTDNYGEDRFLRSCRAAQFADLSPPLQRCKVVLKTPERPSFLRRGIEVIEAIK